MMVIYIISVASQWEEERLVSVCECVCDVCSLLLGAVLRHSERAAHVAAAARPENGDD